MASSEPTNAPWYAPAPMMKAIAEPIAAMSPTWRTPPNRATFRTALSLAKLSSKPSVKSKNWTPSCEILCSCTISLANPNPPCPSSDPARKYPLMVGCPSAAISWPARAEVMISRLMSRISWGSSVSPIDPSLFGFESTYSLSCESMILSTSDSTEASLFRCSVPASPSPTSPTSSFFPVLWEIRTTVSCLLSSNSTVSLYCLPSSPASSLNSSFNRSSRIFAIVDSSCASSRNGAGAPGSTAPFQLTSSWMSIRSAAVSTATSEAPDCKVTTSRALSGKSHAPPTTCWACDPHRGARYATSKTSGPTSERSEGSVIEKKWVRPPIGSHRQQVHPTTR